MFERVIEARLRKSVNIDNMQFGFSVGKVTVDAIFILRQVQGKFLEQKKELWLAFVDLENGFECHQRCYGGPYGNLACMSGW